MGLSIRQVVAQTPFRSPKRIFDHSKVSFTANLKLTLWAQTLGLQPFHFKETHITYKNIPFQFAIAV
jgi:hypothetical protein